MRSSSSKETLARTGGSTLMDGMVTTVNVVCGSCGYCCGHWPLPSRWHASVSSNTHFFFFTYFSWVWQWMTTGQHIHIYIFTHKFHGCCCGDWPSSSRRHNSILSNRYFLLGLLTLRYLLVHSGRYRIHSPNDLEFWNVLNLFPYSKIYCNRYFWKYLKPNSSSRIKSLGPSSKQEIRTEGPCRIY